MFYRLIAFSLIASLCCAQAPMSPQQSGATSPPPGPTPHTTSAGQDSIIVPAGTTTALKLITAIKSKSSKPGDPVRAIVAFPVTVGSRVAIPAGTYVDGVVEKVKSRPAPGDNESAQFHFTRLLFANGYSVPLVATNTQSMLLPPDTLRPTALLADARDGAPNLGESFTPAQTNPEPPPLHRVGPSPGVLAGIGIGSIVGILALAFTIGHHRAGSIDYLVFDSGWQFQMTLQEPLTLDATQVAAS
jgi:type IV secretion system protein VirB10